jgi:hypothetical protein
MLMGFAREQSWRRRWQVDVRRASLDNLDDGSWDDVLARATLVRQAHALICLLGRADILDHTAVLFER